MIRAFEFTGFPRSLLAAIPPRGVLARLAAIFRSMRRRHRARVTVQRLESLNDWQLKDIGLHRSQIWHMADEASTGSIRRGHAPD